LIRRLDELPKVADGGPDDPDWHPITHFFGLTAFGLNAFIAREAGQVLVGEHDETASGQEEVYVLMAGRARVTLDGDDSDVDAVTIVALPSAPTRRAVVALEPGTTLLAIGAPARERFESTWRASHFDDVPQVRD
jgi:hypothetical protein